MSRAIIQVNGFVVECGYDSRPTPHFFGSVSRADSEDDEPVYASMYDADQEVYAGGFFELCTLRDKVNKVLKALGVDPLPASYWDLAGVEDMNHVRHFR